MSEETTERLLEWLDFSINNDTLICTKGGKGVLKQIRDIVASSQWQPIENAPRKGEQFLVTDGECVVMAEWSNPEIDVWDTTCHQVFSDKSVITHWKPLPKPPREGEK